MRIDPFKNADTKFHRILYTSKTETKSVSYIRQFVADGYVDMLIDP